MNEKKKIRVIREIPPEIKEVKTIGEVKKETGGEEETPEEGLEEEVGFVREETEEGFSGFVANAPTPTLQSVEEATQDLETEVESAPVTTPITGTGGEEPAEEPPGDYVLGYESERKYEEQERATPIIRQTRGMEETGMIIKRHEIGERRVRTVMTEPEEARVRRRQPDERVLEAERREEEKGLPFERKYKGRKL